MIMLLIKKFTRNKVSVDTLIWNVASFCPGVKYSTSGISKCDFEEVRIPVPWGHIAGKWWGRKDEIPMLGIHGWQDNAATFDRLLPLLNTSSFLSIDLPGHGQSSHLPHGKLYTMMDYFFTIRRIVNHFEWKKYSIFGHSFGSALGFIYSSLYSDEVDCFISFECGRCLLLAYTVNFPDQRGQAIDQFLKLEEKIKSGDSPSYTLKEAVKLFITGSLASLDTLEAILTLLERGSTKVKINPNQIAKGYKKPSDLDFMFQSEVSKSEDKKIVEMITKKIKIVENEICNKITDSDFIYKLTKDPRIKIFSFGMFNEEIIFECSKHIRCPVLMIKAKNGFLNHGSKKKYDETGEIVKNNSRYFEACEVEGNHHSHLNTPEYVAPVVNNFLKHIKEL